jgi:proteasome lid subunit RPN8/RPN11
METLSIEKVVITQDLNDEICDINTTSGGHEHCGFYLGNLKSTTLNLTSFAQVANIVPITMRNIDYEMHPQQMMDVLFDTSLMDEDSDVHPAAIHTHPRNVGIPSMVDIDKFKSGSGYNIPYLIYGGQDERLRAWKWDYDQDTFVSLELEIV